MCTKYFINDLLNDPTYEVGISCSTDKLIQNEEDLHECLDRFQVTTIFFGKFLNMTLILPDDINDQGLVISPSFHIETLDLLSDEVKWLTNDNTLYIAPQVVFLSYNEDDPEDNGWRTIQSSSYLMVNSLLTLVLDMGEIIESQEPEDNQIK